MERESGLSAIPFIDIPDKSPDKSHVEIKKNLLLKRKFSKHPSTKIHGLWKAIQEEWDKIPVPKLQNGLLCQFRCRNIIQKNCYQIKYLKLNYVMLNISVSAMKIV